jgi:serine/threonine protein kinase
LAQVNAFKSSFSLGEDTGMIQIPFQFDENGDEYGKGTDSWSEAVSSQPNEQDNIIRLNLSQCLNPDCLASNPGNIANCQRCGSTLRLAGRYRAVQTIGAGGFASTFRAVDEHRLGTPCVIKQFLPQQQDSRTYQKAVDLFTQEAVLLKDLGSHPQIPELMAFLEQDGRLYIVQEFIEGYNLLQEFERRGCFNEADIEQMLKSLLPVLQFIHDSQVIHRDLKPSNIIRQTDGSLVIIDFGSSHQSYTRLFSRRTPRTATPGYAPPEQMRGEIFPSSDLFSLGLTCLRLLTGYFPDRRGVDPLLDESQQEWRLENHMQTCNGSLSKVFKGLLQTNAINRYASAQAALEDLADATEVCWVGASTTSENDADLANEANAAEIDYSYLQSLLEEGAYQAADEETWRILLNLTGCTVQNSLTLDVLEFISSSALQTIDRLWWVHSQGRFGLRVQHQCYRELGGTTEFNFSLWEQFAEQVGWCRNRHWLNYTELTFSDHAPMGHLPTCCVDSLNRQGEERGVCGWWRLGFVTLMERLENG